MTPRDPVRALLAARGCPAFIVDQGLPGLVEEWRSIVARVEQGQVLNLDDYLNDMDLRDLIAAALDVASPEEASVGPDIDALDARHKAATVACGSLWGDDIAAEEGLDPGREWWYYRRPISLSTELREDLEIWGLLENS